MSSVGCVKEGLAEILPIDKNQVFYNKAQVFNRDLSVLVLNVFADLYCKDIGLNVLEGLAASGLRSVRYAKEVRSLKNITSNDLDKGATEHILRNRDHNAVPASMMTVSNGDACIHMYENRNKYNVIDLDPYGSASPFYDAAVQSVVGGGLLCITCTDSAVLCGKNTACCFERYGGVAVKAPFCHELSIRLILNGLSAAAVRYKRGIVPLACFSIDFYYRVFVRIVDSPLVASLSVCNTSMLFKCCQCENFVTVRLGQVVGSDDDRKVNGTSMKPGRLTGVGSGVCDECGGQYSIGGPFWSGPIFDRGFLDACIGQVEVKEEQLDELFPGITSWSKLRGLFYGLRNELVDVSFFYTLPGLMSLVRAQECKMKVFRSQLRRLGYRVSQSHREASAIKTDAPTKVVFDLLRIWCKRINTQGDKARFPSILKKEVPTTEEYKVVDFSTCDEEDEKRVPMYLPNPETNWGPKPAAKRQKS